MKICIFLKILRNGCFVKVVLQRKCVLKCSENVLVLNPLESTGGRQKVLYELFGDFFSGLGAVWIVFKNLSYYVVQYDRAIKIVQVTCGGL